MTDLRRRILIGLGATLVVGGWGCTQWVADGERFDWTRRLHAMRASDERDMRLKDIEAARSAGPPPGLSAESEEAWVRGYDNAYHALLASDFRPKRSHQTSELISACGWGVCALGAGVLAVGVLGRWSYQA